MKGAWVWGAGCSSGRSPLGGTAFDLVTKSIVFARLGPPHAATNTLISPGSSSCTPARIPVRSGASVPICPAAA